MTDRSDPDDQRITHRNLDFEDASQIPTGEGGPIVIAQEHGQPRLIALTGNATGELYPIPEGTTTIGRSSGVGIQVDDHNASRKHCLILCTGGAVRIRDLGSTNGSFVNGERVDGERDLVDGDKLQIGSATIFRFSVQDSIEEDAHRQLYESALLDGLTKCYNKKYFLTRLESEVAFSLRHQTLLSLVLFDVDHFKLVNDTHGHPAGDYVLASLAEVVSHTMRKEDVFSRAGGEEFAVISRGIDLDGAVAFGERIRKAVQGKLFSFKEVAIPITISLGVSELSRTHVRNGEQFLELADRALYAAKAGGRNRVVIG